MLITVALLERSPTDEEFSSWITAVRSGEPTGARVRRLLVAPEFVDRF